MDSKMIETINISEESENRKVELAKQTDIAIDLVARCKPYISTIAGCRKLQRKCQAELNYLQRVCCHQMNC